MHAAIGSHPLILARGLGRMRDTLIVTGTHARVAVGARQNGGETPIPRFLSPGPPVRRDIWRRWVRAAPKETVGMALNERLLSKD